MIRRALHALAVVVVTAALLVTATPGNAAAANGCPNPFWGLFCPPRYLMTGFGPLAQTAQISAAGADVRFGLYSPETDVFTPDTAWMDMVKNQWIRRNGIRATDGVVAPIEGYASVNTPYGEGAYVTQYFFDYGRWGTYNFVTNTFYPSSDWFPASCGC